MRLPGSAVVLPAVWAIAASAVSMALLTASRAADPFGAPDYLEWNLLLAWIPLVLGYLLWWCARLGCPRVVLVLAAAMWLVFLPNAPYLLTDLVHAGTANGGTSALDVLTLAAFAATGLVLFFASVTAASEGVRLTAGNRLARTVIPVSAVLASIGMYLGRVLRWNSWDLLVRPMGRVEATLLFLRSPTDLLHAATFILVAAIILLACVAVLERVMLRHRT
jgi:uncharacterized membrane protein